MSGVTKIINSALDNNMLKVFLVLWAGVYAGYTLQPVPAVLQTLFNESVPFKYIILLVIALTAMHPLDNNKLAIAVVMPVVLLSLFAMLR